MKYYKQLVTAIAFIFCAIFIWKYDARTKQDRFKVVIRNDAFELFDTKTNKSYRRTINNNFEVYYTELSDLLKNGENAKKLAPDDLLSY